MEEAQLCTLAMCTCDCHISRSYPDVYPNSLPCASCFLDSSVLTLTSFIFSSKSYVARPGCKIDCSIKPSSLSVIPIKTETLEKYSFIECISQNAFGTCVYSPHC